MLPHCGMAENIGSQTTLVCSNQQCSGPLYKGVRQSVSKKAGPPAEPGPANKWLEVKKKKRERGSFKHMQQVASRSSFLSLQRPSFMGNNSIENLVPATRSPQCTSILTWLGSQPSIPRQPVPMLGSESFESSTRDCLSYCVSAP